VGRRLLWPLDRRWAAAANRQHVHASTSSPAMPRRRFCARSPFTVARSWAMRSAHCCSQPTKRMGSFQSAAHVPGSSNRTDVCCKVRHRRRRSVTESLPGIPEAIALVLAAGEGGSESHRNPSPMKGIPAQQMVLAVRTGASERHGPLLHRWHLPNSSLITSRAGTPQLRDGPWSAVRCCRTSRAWPFIRLDHPRWRRLPGVIKMQRSRTSCPCNTLGCNLFFKAPAQGPCRGRASSLRNGSPWPERQAGEGRPGVGRVAADALWRFQRGRL